MGYGGQDKSGSDREDHIRTIERPEIVIVVCTGDLGLKLGGKALRGVEETDRCHRREQTVSPSQSRGPWSTGPGSSTSNFPKQICTLFSYHLPLV